MRRRDCRTTSAERQLTFDLTDVLINFVEVTKENGSFGGGEATYA